MKDEKIIEAMVRLEYGDHWTIYVKRVQRPITIDGWHGGFETVRDLPDYLNDHNAVQRVIDGLNSLQLVEYSDMLEVVCMPTIYTSYPKVLKATPRQKCEAILRAKGLWE